MSVWKQVIGYNGNYKVNEDGEVFSARSNKLLKKQLNRGYFHVSLYDGQKTHYASVARLVAQGFILNPENCPQVNHKNGKKLDNSVKNLEWCTSSENIIHSFKMGLSSNRGVRNNHSKLNELQVRVIKWIKEIPNRSASATIGKVFGVSRQTIEDIWMGRCWKNIILIF